MHALELCAEVTLRAGVDLFLLQRPAQHLTQKVFSEYVLVSVYGLIPEQWRMVSLLSISAIEK